MRDKRREIVKFDEMHLKLSVTTDNMPMTLRATVNISFSAEKIDTR